MTTDEGNNIRNDHLEILGQQFMAAGAPILSALAKIEALRAERNQRFLNDLASILPADHPAVMRRKQKLDEIKAIEQGLRSQAERLKRRPTITAGQSLVYGQVLNRRGQPIQNAHVSIMAESSETPAATVTTDENGDFAFVHPTPQVSDQPQPLQQRRLLVTTEEGSVLYRSDQPFSLPAGSRYLEIQISAVAPADVAQDSSR